MTHVLLLAWRSYANWMSGSEMSGSRSVGESVEQARACISARDGVWVSTTKEGIRLVY